MSGSSTRWTSTSARSPFSHNSPRSVADRSTVQPRLCQLGTSDGVRPALGASHRTATQNRGVALDANDVGNSNALRAKPLHHFGLSRGVGHSEQLVVFGLCAQHQILGMAYAGVVDPGDGEEHRSPGVTAGGAVKSDTSTVVDSAAASRRGDQSCNTSPTRSPTSPRVEVYAIVRNPLPTY